MSTPFNDLTPEEAERLAMLIEECGEVIQAATKVLRHGYENHHPNQNDKAPAFRFTNRDALRREIIDLYACVVLLWNNRDIEQHEPAEVVRELSKKLWYTHHQDV